MLPGSKPVPGELESRNICSNQIIQMARFFFFFPKFSVLNKNMQDTKNSTLTFSIQNYMQGVLAKQGCLFRVHHQPSYERLLSG